MRLTAIAALFACAIIFAANSSTANAQASDLLETKTHETVLLASNVPKLAPGQPEVKLETIQVAATQPPQTYEVKNDDSLTKIADQFQTTWMKIYNKNPNLTDPDTITPGTILTIPIPDEILPERPLPQPVVVETQVKTASKHIDTASKVTSRGSSSGNTYAPGYCTWYVKNMRPDMPNNLGNANTWVARAAAQGLPTGSEPRVGAVGQQGMHVVYVTAVNGDGTVTISEMNYKGLYVVSTRTVPSHSFNYIY
jgi:surface antigen